MDVRVIGPERLAVRHAEKEVRAEGMDATAFLGWRRCTDGRAVLASPLVRFPRTHARAQCRRPRLDRAAGVQHHHLAATRN